MTTTTPVQLVCPHCGVINRLPAQKLGDHPNCGKCKQGLISGMPVSATDDDFERLIAKTELPVVVDFWAPWCGPCQSFAPTFTQVAGEMATRAVFVKLDTQDHPNTAARYQIRSIPTLALFHRGREITRLAGALPKAQFQQWLEQQLARL